MELDRGRVLLVTNLYAPINNIGSIRITKLSKYLNRKGWDVSVICEAHDEGYNIDESLFSSEMETIHVHRIGYSQLLKKTLQKKRNKYRASSKKDVPNVFKTTAGRKILPVAIHVFDKIRDYNWYRQVEKYISCHSEDFGHIDCVITSYQRTSSHWIGRMLIKKGIADHWIADYRDYFGAHSQRNIINSADIITGVSKGLVTNIKNVKKDARVSLIYNGFDPDERSCYGNTSTDESLVMLYAGSFYEGYNDFSPLFRAINDLLKEGLIEKETVKIRYAGGQFDILQQSAERSGLLIRVENKGLVTRQEVLQLYEEADIALVSAINNKDYQGMMTGKIYECFLEKKPIIALISGDVPHSELASVINAVQAGFAYEEADGESSYMQLKSYILNKVIEKKKYGRIKTHYNEEKVCKYSYEYIADQFDSLLKKLQQEQV